MDIAAQESIAGTFARLDGLRTERLQASEQYAYFTIPAVFPAEDRDNNTRGVGMLDSIGSIVANHFANKLVTTLFSPNRPFFRLAPRSTAPQVRRLEEAKASDDVTEQQAAKTAFDQLRQKFVTTEKDAVRYLERIGYRTAATNAAKLLIITGDTVIRSTKDKKSTVYSMRDYVCQKDVSGRDVLLIVRDSMVFGALPPAQQALIADHVSGNKDYHADTPVVIYTKMALQMDGRYAMTQAIDDIPIISDAEAKIVTERASPFTHLSWNLYKGEDYGRGLVEDFSGSFNMIDSLTSYQVLLSGKIADLKIMVDPASGIDVQQLNDSGSGTYVAGRKSDTGAMEIGGEQALAIIEGTIEKHKRQISAAFLYQSGNTRDAERVTAEEIRENAAELEIAHGGVYSRFASDWQEKAAHESIAAVGENLGDLIEPQIMTGMDSLSRTGEMQMVRVWLQDLSMLNNVPEDVRAWLNAGDFASYAALQRGIDSKAFVKTREQVEAEQKQAQEQERQMLQAQAQMQAQGQMAAKAIEE